LGNANVQDNVEALVGAAVVVVVVVVVETVAR
jgi:hypothetical protein